MIAKCENRKMTQMIGHQMKNERLYIIVFSVVAVVNVVVAVETVATIRLISTEKFYTFAAHAHILHQTNKRLFGGIVTATL